MLTYRRKQPRLLYRERRVDRSFQQHVAYFNASFHPPPGWENAPKMPRR